MLSIHKKKQEDIAHLSILILLIQTFKIELQDLITCWLKTTEVGGVQCTKTKLVYNSHHRVIVHTSKESGSGTTRKQIIDRKNIFQKSPQFQQNVNSPRILDKNYEQFSTQLTPRVRKKAQIGQSSAQEHEDSLELFKRNYHMKLARDQDLDYFHNNNAKSNKTYILNLEDDYNIDNKIKQAQSNQKIVHKQNPYLNINLPKKQKRDRAQKQIYHHKNSPTYNGSYKNILNPIEQIYQIIHKNDKNQASNESKVGNYQTMGNEKDQGKVWSPTYISSKLGI